MRPAAVSPAQEAVPVSTRTKRAISTGGRREGEEIEARKRAREVLSQHSEEAGRRASRKERHGRGELAASRNLTVPCVPVICAKTRSADPPRDVRSLALACTFA
eukprot:1934138-Pleurochrysis_carterae.AAC.1